MKREIKFRAFYKSQIIYNIELAVSKGIHYFFDGKDILIDVPLMQFTGLKDKNGKAIYEGDICKFGSGRIKEIEWQQGGFGFQPDKEWRDEFVGFSGHGEFRLVMEHIEVIGNIYETPNLLKT